MKKGITKLGPLGVLAIVFSFLTPFAVAEDKPTASVDAAILSKYVWRGYELSNDSIVVQPSLTAGYWGFRFGIWGNLDLEYDDGDPTTKDVSNWNETDFTIAYEKAFSPATVGIGYIYYALDAMDDSKEIFMSVALDVPLSPSLTVYREISHAQAWYINLGLEDSVDLTKGMTLEISGSAGYYISDNDGFVEVDDTLTPTTKKYKNFHNGLISAAVSIPVAEYFTIAPTVSYSFPLSKEADNLITYLSISNDSSFFYGGVILSMSF